MNKLPSAFWATIFIITAFSVVVVVLFCHAPDNVKQNVLTIASSVVTGAFGYIQGKRETSDSITIPTNPTPTVKVEPPPETKENS